MKSFEKQQTIMDYRITYEHLMLRAFGLTHRKEVRFADADFFDLESEKAISTAMMAAFCNLRKEDDSNHEWLDNAIRMLESRPEDRSTICQILSELPLKYQF